MTKQKFAANHRAMAQPVHILHLHSTFDLGGKEARAVQLMNAFGDRARHTIVSGMPDQLGARDGIAPGIRTKSRRTRRRSLADPRSARYEAIATTCAASIWC